MKKIFRWVGSLLIGAFFLILLIALVGYLKPKGRMEEAFSFPTPSPTPFVSPWESATLDQIRFGEPKVVLTGTLGFRIMGWISNEEVLIRRAIKPGGRGSAFEVFNVETKEVRRLAEGAFPGNPVWNHIRRALIYLEYDETRKQSDLIWQSLDTGEKQKLASDVVLPIVLVGGGKGAVAYDIGEKALRGRLVGPLAEERRIPFGQYAMRIPTPYGWEYKTAVSPDGEWQVVYNCEHFLLLDTKEGEIREIDLGTEGPGGKGLPRWAMDAQWSPDGRQVAIASTFGDFLPRPTQLLILDPWGENVREIKRPPGLIFSEVDWAPDGRHLLISGSEAIGDRKFLPRMWLVDVKMERMRNLDFFPIARSEDPRGRAAWSPDGKHIIFYCRPKSVKGPALCLASVDVER